MLIYILITYELCRINIKHEDHHKSVELCRDIIHLLELEPLGISQFYSRKSNYTSFNERYREIQCREILSSAYPYLRNIV